MTKYTLKFSDNMFLNLTKGFPEKAVQLFMFHLMRLKVLYDLTPYDVDYRRLYRRSLPVGEEFQKRYFGFKEFEEAKNEHERILESRINELKGSTGKAKDWHYRIVSAHVESNPERIMLLWNMYLKTLYGDIEGDCSLGDVVAALKGLSESMDEETHADMVDLKAEIDKKFKKLDILYNVHQKNLEIWQAKQMKLDLAFTNAMKMEYRNAGALMEKFPNNENHIQESFHDLELLFSIQPIEKEITKVELETKRFPTRLRLAKVAAAKEVPVAMSEIHSWLLPLDSHRAKVYNENTNDLQKIQGQ